MNHRISLNWEQWVVFCRDQNIDPRENCECGFDLGGGDSEEYYCYDTPPPEEESNE